VDHQRVARGEILFRLRDDLLRAELAAAQAALDQTGQQTGAGAAQVSAARAEVVRAEAALDGAEKSYGRTRALFDRGDVARAALDSAQAARDQALATRDAALAQLAAAQRQLGVTGAGNPTVRAAAARLAQAQIALSDATVRSPADGWIANLTLRPGAMVAAGQPLFALVEDGDWWIEANFKETDLDRIRPGQPARITLDMYPGLTLEGRVESIGPGSGAVFSLLPPQNASGNWVKVTQRFPVRIRIGPAPEDPERPLRVGASSTVRIDTTRPE
jgi:membrane fusion protein (multidrug efflux system)